MISDLEFGQLYWNCYKKCKDEKTACQKVKDKYFHNFKKNKDVWFFLGITLQYYNIGRNPFIIVGVFYPPKASQLELF